MTAEANPGAPRSARHFRRLVAVMHLDVVAYSRLMGEDEEGTHNRVKHLHGDVRRIAADHGGRVVNTAGDAALLDFPSVVNAVDAALAIQDTTRARDAGRTGDERFEVRIGINLGDVIDDAGDLYGDGVNVAQRVETLAPAGGIAVTASVRQQIGRQRPLTFDDLGVHRAKNIAEPLQVYALWPETAPARARRQAARRRPGRWRVPVALAAFALLATGLAAWLFADRFATQPGDVLAGKPTVAVLPFVDRSPEPRDTWFSDGVTEDVIAQLGRVQGLFVLSWNAVAPYRDRRMSPEAVGKELGARYLVSGSITRAGERLRVNVELTDAQEGVLLWSQQLQEDVVDIFDLQAELANLVAGSLAARVSSIERARAFEKPTDSMDAYDYVLRGREALRALGERSSNLSAREFFQRAIELDPRYADAYAGMGWTYTYDAMLGWTEQPQRAFRKAVELARRAIALEHDNVNAHSLMSYTLLATGDLTGARRHVDIALESNPNDTHSLTVLGRILLLEGKVEEAVAPVELAIRLDTSPPSLWLFTLSQAYYSLGRYHDATALLHRYRDEIGADPAPLAILAASEKRLGNDEAAAEVVAAVKRISPFFDADNFAAFFAGPAQREHLREGLEQAGL